MGVKLSKNKEWKMFNLVKACQDCPFKKGMTYLTGLGALERINDVRYNDASFTCHKTIDYDAFNELEEIENDIKEELEFLRENGCSHQDLFNKRIELAQELGLHDAIQKYEATRKDEMYCAGMLILAKKSGFLMNNRALRYAVASNLLDPNKFIDEDEVYDSVEQAVEAHKNG